MERIRWMMNSEFSDKAKEGLSKVLLEIEKEVKKNDLKPDDNWAESGRLAEQMSRLFDKAKDTKEMSAMFMNFLLVLLYEHFGVVVSRDSMRAYQLGYKGLFDSCLELQKLKKEKGN